MAEKITAGAPPGWRRAEVRGFAAGNGGSGHHGFTYEPTDEGAADVDVHEELCAIHTLTGSTSDHLSIELTVEAGGRYEAVISESLERDGEHGFRYVLNPHTLPPEPADFQQGPPHATPAGDPAEAVALLGAYLRERDRILNGADTYAPPPALPEARRTWLESRLPARLPDDLRALYAHVDGDGGEGLLAGHPWFGLDLVEENSRPENRWWASGRAWRHHLRRPLITGRGGSPLAVRRASDHPRWIPFATSTLGDFLAVDLAPGPEGRPGQVIRMGVHHDDGPLYVADSVTSLLRRHVTALRSGSYQVEQDGLWIDLGYEDDEGEDSLTVAGADATTMRGLHHGIHRLSVRNAPWADFGPVRGAPMLWQVSVANCPGADLSPLQDTPVELLDLAMDTIDLTPLANHAALRFVTLRTERPVDLAPLLSCPRLYALDLSGAAIGDIGVLAELKQLLYLRLRRAQWQELQERGGPPAGLAAAGLAAEPLREKSWWWSADKAYHAPEPSLRTAIAWAADLAGESADVQVFKGRLPRQRHR
ncbi:SMI1/KNR4 family protein [Nonomuraea sp. NPDC050404]|uniref:SMI1/KNR4 family protein n=1 Tax=Nonomuraea sp. NPDC050404 TaxID=3155783 RepID=UPI0033C5245A